MNPEAMLLAEAAAGAEGGGLAEILPWVTTFVVAVLGVVLAPMLKKRGEQEGRQMEREERAVSINGQPVGVEVHELPPTRAELDALEQDIRELRQDIDEKFGEIKAALNDERGIARTANGNIHKRIDALSERLGDRLAKLEGGVDGIADTVGKLLDIALNTKKPTGR